MNFRKIDLRLILGIIIAHLLLFFTFQDRAIFWYILSASLLLLITYATSQGHLDDEIPFSSFLLPGILSGLLLFGIFWLGNWGIHVTHLPFHNSIKKLYHWFAPSQFWEYLALVLVAAPGEEIFWRGFIQKRLMNHFKPWFSVIIGSILYASVQTYSGQFILAFAAFVCGIAWGALYLWKKSMPLVIVSHLVFDIMLFIIMPLH